MCYVLRIRAKQHLEEGETMRDFELQSLKSLRTVPLVRVKVTSSSEKDHSLAVSLKDTVALLKDRALGGEFCKESSSYKLVLAKSNRVLLDGNTLEEEGIHEDDELILLKRRKSNPCCDQEKEKKRPVYKIPDVSTIQQLTASIPSAKENDTASASASSHFNFNTELRRILVSLIDSSILLQSVDEESSDENSKGEDQDLGVDPATLKQLTDMGFGKVRATKALLANRMSPMLAMEWLLQHEGDSDIDEPVITTVSQGRARRKRREFTPNPRAVKNLKEMGFEEEDIVMALKVTGNSQEAACEWILGDRKEELTNSDEGLDPESPMYKAIMENPLVQLSLYNPRVLGAFEDMLDSPATSAVYINDPETGPVLLQISRIVQGFAR